MTRTSLSDFHCSWARAIDILGDKWILLILRDAFGGISTFSGFLRSTGMARNVLSNRLDRLVSQQILSRRPTGPDGARHEYVMTERGKALFPVIIAIGQWGDKWIFGSEGEPVLVLDRASKAPVQPVAVVGRDGRYLSSGDVVLAPGPNLDARTKKVLERRFAGRKSDGDGKT